MKYSKTLGSVALSALLLMGTTGCSDSDTIVEEVSEVVAATDPIVEEQYHLISV